MNTKKKPSRPPNLAGVQVRKLVAADGEGFVRFFHAAGQTEQTLSAFQWQYVDIPEDPIWIYCAEPDDPAKREEAVFGAIYCVAPRRFKVDDQQVMGSLSLQTLTGQDYRKRGLFVHLARTCYEHAAAEGMVFVYGSPNDNSMPGFLKHLEWQRLPDLKLWACVRPFAHLRGMVGFDKQLLPRLGFTIRPVHSLHTPLDDLWRRFSKLVKIGAVRDAAFWNWRYLMEPDSNTRIFVVEASDGRAMAACAVATRMKKEGRRGHIVDFMYDPDSHLAAGVLLEWCTSKLSKEGCRLVVTCVSGGTPYVNLLRANAFWPVPDRYHPPGPRLALAVLDPTYEHLIRRSAEWHVTLGDYDVL